MLPQPTWNKATHFVLIITLCLLGGCDQGLSQNIEDTPPKYTEYVDDQHYGYTRIHVYNATTLQVEFLVDHKLSDTMVIDRQ